MDRIAACFRKAKEARRGAFVAYICAGDPDYKTSLEVCRTLIEGGIDLLELGMPFSDPLADGITNQHAAERALLAGVTQDQVFALAKAVREMTDIPIIFYTYYNLVLAHGEERFARRCVEVGVDGVLTLDLPPEYAGEMLAACRAEGLKNIFIIAPTTPPERVKIITDVASGFIYYVSREGVTGERSSLASNIGEQVSLIRQHTDLPVAVGFGISTQEHVREVARVADGIVVGSALVNCIARNMDARERIIPTLREKVADLVAGARR